jgi:SAM-dependent methyltransferase
VRVVNEPTAQPSMTQLWAGESGRRWSAAAHRLEAQLEPLGDLLLSHSELAPGEHVLDVGCGRGVTTRRAAELVGATGRVVGVDVSPTLIDDARSLSDAAHIEWLVADAQHAALGNEAFDVVISRFGAIFFDDPVAAYANLAAATAPGGRLCVLVWQRRDASDVLDRPLSIAVRVLRDAGREADPGDPSEGPYAYGDARYTRDVLRRAGWEDVTLAPHRRDLYLAGPASVEDAVDGLLAFGPVQRLVADAPEDVVSAVRAALVAELASDHDGTGVKLGSAVTVVRARRNAGKN